ncbi:ACP phosphodiesterase [Luteolibacter algae]|uniref:ACP phosphodiesterase n=1 Tax=Luteolibacter algae TaxID=454151 RepID=A0ABW5D4N9_9BACT
MNFLAHLYLAEASDESLVGNILGDFVKGRPETLQDRFPEGVITGIRQHRAIDAFTDSHSSFARSRILLPAHRRRLAGVVVDVFYDYFLSQQWIGGEKARKDFIHHCYDTLRKHDSWFNPLFREALPRMISENWLECYSSLPGLALTFRRIASRGPAASPVLGAEEDLANQLSAFEANYSEFFPQLCRFSRTWTKTHA